MERVLDRLWIGGAEDFKLPLVTLGFSGVLDLRDMASDQQREFVGILSVWHIMNRDGDPWNREQVLDAMDFIDEQLARGSVLVACTAGMSRSASMMVGYLVKTGWSAPEAIACVRQARPQILPVSCMLESVLRALK